MREKIGKVVTVDGDEYDVCVLLLSDIIKIPVGCDDMHYRFAAAAVGVEFEEFLNWHATDVFKVISIMGDGIRVLG